MAGTAVRGPRPSRGACVLVARGGADRLELAAGQHRLEIEAASIAPSAAPAPTSVLQLVDLNSTMSRRVRISLRTS